VISRLRLLSSCLLFGQLNPFLIKFYKNLGQVQWLKLVIQAIWEVEIKRIAVQSQPGHKVHETPSEQMTGYSGAHLASKLCGEAEIGGP
jgi:hypothetical protein